MSTQRGRIHFLKTTVIGGLVFLVPVVATLFILTEAANLMLVVAQPLAKFIPVDSIAGVAVANIVAALAVVLVCFLAGLVARRAMVRSTVDTVEKKVLSKIPGYIMLRGMLSGFEETDDHRLYPVLATLASSARVGLEIDRLSDGRVVVMIPTSPNPWSGMVHILDEERVQRLDLPMAAFVENVERFGRGTEELLMAARSSETESS